MSTIQCTATTKLTHQIFNVTFCHRCDDALTVNIPKIFFYCGYLVGGSNVQARNIQNSISTPTTIYTIQKYSSIHIANIKKKVDYLETIDVHFICFVEYVVSGFDVQVNENKKKKKEKK